MIFISILTIIVAIALPSYKTHISSILVPRISAIIFIFSGVLVLNAFYIQSIGSGVGIYSGLFHVTIISSLLDAFLLLLAALILMSWPLVSASKFNLVITLITLLKDGSSSPKYLFTKNLSSPILETPGAGINSVEEGNGAEATLEGNKKSKPVWFNYIGIYTPRTEYCLIVLFSALGSSFLLSSSDLLSMYLSIELQSFGVYILATLYRDYETATSSGLKYFLLGGLSSCFILLGAGLIYTFTGLTNLESIYTLLSVFQNSTLLNVNNIVNGLSLGLMLIFIGFLFKIAAGPLHSWSPDVYDETPTQVTFWLTIIPKISIFVLLLELLNGFSINSLTDLPVIGLSSLPTGDNTIGDLNLIINMSDITYKTSYLLTNLLLISSLLSLIIGTVLGLGQTRIKRLLAYSTITHVGFILLALAINTQQSIDSFIFYILQYSITNLNVFLIIIALGFVINKTGIKYEFKSNNVFFFDFDLKYLKTLQGQYFSNPILSLSLAVCLFSMSGIPPLLGFFSKLFVLLSAVQSGYWFMALVCILTSVIGASYYLRVVVLLFTESEILKSITVTTFPSLPSHDVVGMVGDDISPASIALRELNLESVLTNMHSILISIATLSILLFIFKPTIYLNSTQLLSLSLFFH